MRLVVLPTADDQGHMEMVTVLSDTWQETAAAAGKPISEITSRVLIAKEPLSLTINPPLILTLQLLWWLLVKLFSLLVTCFFWQVIYLNARMISHWLP